MNIYELHSQESAALLQLLIINEINTPLFNIKVSLSEVDNSVNTRIKNTDKNGRIDFYIDYSKTYNLTAYDTNYSPYFKKVIIGFSNERIKIDTIILKSKQLYTPTITVEASKNFMTIQDDKIIFELSKMKSDPGINALELMRKIPMMSVENETVLLRGSSPLILVNGRQSEIYNNLKSIPTELIDKVEVYTIVPSKYEANNSGVVNIVLKKFEEAKYRIFSSTSTTIVNALNTYLGGSYKKNKISLFSNMNFSLAKSRNTNVLSTKNLQNNSIFSNTADTNESKSSSYNVNGGFIYDINDNFYIGTEGILNKSPSNGFDYTYKKYFGSIEKEQILLSNSSANSENNSVLTYATMGELFTKDELNFELLASNSNYNSSANQYEIAQINNKLFYDNKTNIYNKNYELKIDYSKKSSDFLKIELGLKGSIRNEKNEYSQNDTIESVSSLYEFKQKIISNYVTVGYVFKSLRIKPGIRLEFANFSGIINESSEFKNNKFDIFPSLLVSNYFKDNSQLQFTYGEKVDRPRFYFLNPFSLNKDLFNTVTGNPDLEPSYSHNFELRFSKPIGQYYFITNLYWRNTKNLIQSQRKIDSIYTYTTFINNGSSNAFGIDGGLNFNFLDYFYSNFYGGINRIVYSDESLNSEQNKFSYNCNFYFGYSNPNIVDFNVSVNYNSQRYSPNRVSSSYMCTNFNLGKNFLNRKFRVAININNPFNKTNSEIIYNRDGYEQKNNYHDNTFQYLNLSVNFMFGNYDENRQRSKELLEDDYSK